MFGSLETRRYSNFVENDNKVGINPLFVKAPRRSLQVPPTKLNPTGDSSLIRLRVPPTFRSAFPHCSTPLALALLNQVSSPVKSPFLKKASSLKKAS